MRTLKNLGTLALVLSAWAGFGLGGSAWATPTIDMLTDMQFIEGAAGSVECQPILVIDDGANITAASDIRIIIPATYSMVWASADTAVEVLLSGTGVVSGTCSYANSNKTLILNVTTGFDATSRIVASGVHFTTWGAVQDFDSLGLAWNGTDAEQTAANQGMCTRDDSTGLLLSSANNFSFSPTGSAASSGTLPQITVTDSATTAVITAASDIRITIPAVGAYGTAPIFNTGVTTVTIGGGASAKVSTTVTYANSSRTCVIDVTTNFAASDTITIDGLKFTIGSNEQYTADSLQLSRDGTFATVNAVDDRIFAIGPPNISVSSVQTITASASNETVSTLTITDHAGTAVITLASDIRLIILGNSSTGAASTGRNNLSWDETASGAPTYGGTASAKVAAAAITTADPITSGGTDTRLLLIKVDTSFAAGDTLTVAGLKVDNATATATQIHIGLILLGYTTNSVTGAYGRVVSLLSAQNATSTGTSGGSSGGGGGCFLDGGSPNRKAAR